MKQSLPSTSRKHQSLLADIRKAGCAQAQQETPRLEDEQSADAQMAAFFYNDGFEQAFAQAECLSETRRPISPPQADMPRGPISARLRQKRPTPLQQQTRHASQRQNVWPLRGFSHCKARLHASLALRQDRVISAAALATNATPTLARAKSPEPSTLPAALSMHADSNLPAFDESWTRATAGQAAARAKDGSTTLWPPKPRL